MSKIWEVFIINCKQRYGPGENITIDEQLLALRGRCVFRIYIANTPANDGLKFMMFCHSKSSYMLNASPYLGKKIKPDAVVLGHYVTMELCKPYFGTKKNIICDNWFTSVPLVKDLLEKGLTYVGTIRKNKGEIPEEMTDKTRFQPKQCAFLLGDNTTLLTRCCPNKSSKELVALLSSMHTQADTLEKGKPELIMYHNKTKGGVDTFDQICSNNSCSRMTRRWTLASFYGMVNAARVNASIVYHSHMVNQGNNTKASEVHARICTWDDMAMGGDKACSVNTSVEHRRSGENDISSTCNRFNIAGTSTTAKAKEV